MESGQSRPEARPPMPRGSGPVHLPLSASQCPAGPEEERLEKGVGNWGRVGGRVQDGVMICYL